MENLKNKLFFLFLFLLLIFPINVLAYSKVYIGGDNVGIKVNSKGVLIVGFYDVNGVSLGEDAGLKIGDLIISIDDKDVSNINDLTLVSYDDEYLDIKYLRNGSYYNTKLKVIYDNNTYKTGLFVKDKIVGIGTLTFITPDGKFMALGHEIVDSTTKTKFVISDGNIFKSDITSIDRSLVNDPGEKNASYEESIVFGNISDNTISGIVGNYNSNYTSKELIDISNDIKTGKAYIRTVVSGDKIEEFEINILKINLNSDIKNILFEVTDKKLLNISNGIVQGMSGSPIIQNNKLVGAVTHVVVDNPNKGFGIIIKNMLKEIEE